MKRRNADCGKLRRPLKRSKITEGIYGSTFLYLKFLLVWGLVLMADFLLEFRFEYLWPFWLLMRSVYDSFKYQGLAFSVFFVCVAVTSDMICYLFIPVQWLFFAASTYVWVQYVWHTERGICLPTVSLWLLFVYIEASVRLRELKSLPFYLDLCRPFAAHCIGYPVVTLGFGFKSYISYRLRLRKQKEIQKENEFYVQLLQKALPAEHQTAEKQKALPSKQEEVISNGTTPCTGANNNSTSTSNNSSSSSTSTSNSKKASSTSNAKSDSSHTAAVPSPPEKDKEKEIKKSGGSSSSGGSTPHIEDLQFMEQTVHKKHNINHYNETDEANEQNAKSFKANGVTRTAKLNSQKDNMANRKGKPNNNTTTVFHNNKDEVIARLESDIRRVKTELTSNRLSEQELRLQVGSLVLGDKAQRAELQQLRQDNDSLQTKLHNLVTSRQQDRQNLSQLERRLQEERRLRSQGEQQLAAERKAKKAEESAAARAVAMANATRLECSDTCKIRRREQENELKQIRREVKLREDQIGQLERETKTLMQYKVEQNDTDVLMSALAALTDKNQHLETSLSSETRLKLDLFSALGDAKRQLEIQQGMLMQKELEISEFKSKIAELLAVNPSTSTFSPVSPGENSPRFSASFATVPTDDEVLVNSSLNPHASDYTPKMSQ